MARRLVRLIAAGALLSAIPFVARPAGAERLCGRVSSAGQPVARAQVVAMDAGRVVSTDDGGRFCLDDLKGATQRIRVFALGFQPGERLVNLGDTGPLVFELVPLRPLSPGGRFGDAESAPAPGSAEPAVPPPPLIPADTSWRNERPGTACDDSLRSLHGALVEAAKRVDEPSPWPRVHRLQAECCGDEPKTGAARPALCDYLRRASAWARHRDLRAGEETPEDREAALEEIEALLTHPDEVVRAWARSLRARGVTTGSASSSRDAGSTRAARDTTR